LIEAVYLNIEGGREVGLKVVRFVKDHATSKVGIDGCRNVVLDR